MTMAIWMTVNVMCLISPAAYSAAFTTTKAITKRQLVLNALSFIWRRCSGKSSGGGAFGSIVVRQPGFPVRHRTAQMAHLRAFQPVADAQAFAKGKGLFRWRLNRNAVLVHD